MVNSEEFCSKTPCEIVPTLADRGIYLGSESTFYKVLEKTEMLAHRGRAHKPQKRPISTHKAKHRMKMDVGHHIFKWPNQRELLY